MHHELTRIAAERSPEKRLELLHKVTDLYLDGVDTNSNSETYLFNEIMEKIVDQFSRDIKKQVSSTLAILPDFPSNIVRKLADDTDIEIARPVLRNAFSLTDEDLVRLAQRGSQAHLTAIAGRATLPEKVTDVLIDRGERDVVHTVTGNHGARFSESGMDRLLDVATLLGTFARLERDHVFKLLYKGHMQTILVLCRSLELSWSTLDAILALRAVKNGETYFSDPRTRAEYDATDVITAQRAIRFLRVRQVAQAQAGQAQGVQLQAGAA
jgi:hypothetical protein